MARKPSSPSQDSQLTLEQMRSAIPRLKKRIVEVENFQPLEITSTSAANIAVAPLEASIDDALSRTFGQNTPEYNRYSNAKYFNWPHNIYGTSIEDVVDNLVDCKKRSILLLNSAITSLEEQIEEHDESDADLQILDDLSAEINDEIFLIHGHDIAARESLARFIEIIGFNPVILHEQPNKGQTIIEKFEQNSNVGFAIALLSPDDQIASEHGDHLYRARQNVILELGYFIGRLGRNRVCALKIDNVELPSDILGVVWTDFDGAGAWKTSLARELKAAGYQIDWNKVMI